MKANCSSEFLGTEKISKLLLSFSMPAFIAMLASGIYNIVDTIFVAKGIGTLANVICCICSNDLHWSSFSNFKKFR